MSNTIANIKKHARKNVYSVKDFDINAIVDHFSHENINYDIKFNIDDYQKNGKNYVVVDSPKRWVTLSKRPIGDFMTHDEYKMFIPRLRKNVYSIENNSESLSKLKEFGLVECDVKFSPDHKFLCFTSNSDLITSSINQVGTYNVFLEEIDCILGKK